MTSKKPKSKLQFVKGQKLAQPPRFLFYGPEGVGKSTLAAYSPSPIVIDVEDGTGELEVPRYQFRDEEGGHVPRTYENVIMAIDDLTQNEHVFKTLIIDTVDALESLLWSYVCEFFSGTKHESFNKKGKRIENIDAFPFNKGYACALDEWRRFCSRLNRLRNKGVAVIMIGHSDIRTWKNPEGDDYDRYQLRVHPKSAGFLKEWVDTAGFCNFEGGVNDMGNRPRGYSTGRRFIHLHRSAAFDAKTRFALPDKVEIAVDDPWQPFAKAMDITHADPKALIKLIRVECERIGDDTLSSAVAAECAKADGQKLIRFLNDLKTRQPQEETTNE